MTNTPHITLVREALLATLNDLRDRQNPMEIERAKAIAQVSSVMVDSAKVEVEYIKATGADRSDFLGAAPTAPQLPAPSDTPTAHNPFPTSRVHRIGD